MKRLSALCVALLAATVPFAAGAASGTTCTFRSGPERATLIELFTSEGCNSCPPADRWLSGLARGAPGGNIVALAFHVDYWDSLGWRDRFASPVYTARQGARRAINRSGFMYTPQVTVDGRDTPAWRRTTTPRQLAAAPAPAGADLRLTISGNAGRYAVRLDAAIKPTAGVAANEAVAYLALYENGLSSAVSAGENKGRTLQHDYVVRDWQGPYHFAADGRLVATQDFFSGDINPARSGVAAVLESADGHQMLQALATPLCP